MARTTAGIRAALIGIASMTGPAVAADLTAQSATQAAAAHGPWQVRVRALGVITKDSGTVDGIAGADLSYSDTVIPELDISYYFTQNIAAELVLGTTYANVHAGGSIAGLGKVGKTWLLPPTLMLQYHFTDFGNFQPYVGAGVNYTIFYNQSDAGIFTDMDVEDSFGGALQIGVDYMIDDHWGFNIDAKKLFLEPDWTANLGTTKLSGTAKLNPWLIGTGVTYRF